jgi:hypothetical protein
MGWLARLRGAGVDVAGPHWEVDAPRGFKRLFRALDGWLPDGAILYFEGGYPSEEIEAFMSSHAVPERTHIAMGTIWPRPRVFHVPASPDVLAQLVTLADHHAAPELAVHFHAYRGDEVLLQAYDVFDQEMWLAASLPEERISELATRLGVSYRREGG